MPYFQRMIFCQLIISLACDAPVKESRSGHTPPQQVEKVSKLQEASWPPRDERSEPLADSVTAL